MICVEYLLHEIWIDFHWYANWSDMVLPAGWYLWQSVCALGFQYLETSSWSYESDSSWRRSSKKSLHRWNTRWVASLFYSYCRKKYKIMQATGIRSRWSVIFNVYISLSRLNLFQLLFFIILSPVDWKSTGKFKSDTAPCFNAAINKKAWGSRVINVITTYGINWVSRWS